MRIGITERGDAALDFSWKDYSGYKILITKDPKKLIDKSKAVDFKKAIIHCTITGLGKTILEPNVPKPEVSLEAYKKFVDYLGPERVVLRVDPLWPEIDFYLENQIPVIEQNISRVRISFLDMYPKVMARLDAINWPKSTAYYYDNKWNIHSKLEFRQNELEFIKKIKTDVEVCGEPGLECTGCISMRDVYALGISPDKISGKLCNQRMACHCLAEKFELLSNKTQCYHGCIYCYWS